MTKTEKAKLTLGIDKNIILSAKRAGINISEITENLLKAVTYESDLIPYDKIVNSFEIFLTEIQKLVKKYDLVTQVGERQYIDHKNSERPPIIEKIILNKAGLYAVDEESTLRKIKVEEVLNDLDPPLFILEVLFKDLIESTEKSQARVHELNFALKLLQSLSEETEERI